MIKDATKVGVNLLISYCTPSLNFWILRKLLRRFHVSHPIPESMHF